MSFNTDENYGSVGIVDGLRDEEQIFSAYGRTMELAQVLEMEIGDVFLAILTIGVQTDKITEEERAGYRGFLNDINKKTFGALLKPLRPFFAVDEDVLSIVDEALKRRNYLAHHFFRHHNHRIHSEEGRGVMKRELDEVCKSLAIAHAHLGAMAGLFQELGGTEKLSDDDARVLQLLGNRLELGELAMEG